MEVPLKYLTRRCQDIYLFSDILDISPEMVMEDEFVDWVAGNKVLEGSIPMAHRWTTSLLGGISKEIFLGGGGIQISKFNIIVQI